MVYIAWFVVVGAVLGWAATYLWIFVEINKMQPDPVSNKLFRIVTFNIAAMGTLWVCFALIKIEQSAIDPQAQRQHLLELVEPGGKSE